VVCGTKCTLYFPKLLECIVAVISLECVMCVFMNRVVGIAVVGCNFGVKKLVVFSSKK
jgi:hypothetical protein